MRKIVWINLMLTIALLFGLIGVLVAPPAESKLPDWRRTRRERDRSLWVAVVNVSLVLEKSKDVEKLRALLRLRAKFVENEYKRYTKVMIKTTADRNAAADDVSAIEDAEKLANLQGERDALKEVWKYTVDQLKTKYGRRIYEKLIVAIDTASVSPKPDLVLKYFESQDLPKNRDDIAAQMLQGRTVLAKDEKTVKDITKDVLRVMNTLRSSGVTADLEGEMKRAQEDLTEAQARLKALGG